MFTNTRTSKSDALASKKALKALSVRVDQLEANHFIVVDSEADLGNPKDAVKSAVYLVPSTKKKEKNIYNEFVAIYTGAEEPVEYEGWAWEQVGSTQVDLAGYTKYTKIDTQDEGPATGKFDITDENNVLTTFYVIPRSILLKDGITTKTALMLATENSWDYTE